MMKERCRTKGNDNEIQWINDAFSSFSHFQPHWLGALQRKSTSTYHPNQYTCMYVHTAYVGRYDRYHRHLGFFSLIVLAPFKSVYVAFFSSPIQHLIPWFNNIDMSSATTHTVHMCG